MTLDETIIHDEIARQQEKDPHVRIFSILHEGETCWVKLTRIHEKWSDRFRGDPAVVLVQEKNDLRALEQRGQAVPRILAEGDGYLVTSDNGVALDILWKEQPQSREHLAVEAAKALARLHKADCIHGAPHLRNLTYKDGSVGFIDLERAMIGTAQAKDKAWDIGKFLYALFGTGADVSLVEATRDAYRAECTADTFAELGRWQTKLRLWKLPISALAWHERTMRPNRNPKIYKAYLQMMHLDLSMS